MIIKPFHFIGVFILLFLSWQANSTILNGNDIQVRFIYPYFDNNLIRTRNVTVGDGPEIFIPNEKSRLEIDIGDNYIQFDFINDFSFANTVYNGYGFVDFTGNIPSFNSVEMDYSISNLPGFTNDLIDFDRDSIFVNFSNLDAVTGSIVKLNITSVPEPPILYLLSSSFILLIIFSRKVVVGKNV